jgi:hypothetical protein
MRVAGGVEMTGMGRYSFFKNKKAARYVPDSSVAFQSVGFPYFARV